MSPNCWRCLAEMNVFPYELYMHVYTEPYNLTDTSYVCPSAHTDTRTHKHMQRTVSLAETVEISIFFGVREVQHQLASTDTLHRTLSSPCLSVSKLSLWNVYDSGAEDKMRLIWIEKANKIAKAHSQLKCRQRVRSGGRKKRRRGENALTQVWPWESIE